MLRIRNPILSKSISYKKTKNLKILDGTFSTFRIRIQKIARE